MRYHLKWVMFPSGVVKVLFHSSWMASACLLESGLRFESTRWHQCSSLAQSWDELFGHVNADIETQSHVVIVVDVHSCPAGWYLCDWLKWCVCFRTCVWLDCVLSLMWHYLFCCLRNGLGFVWIGTLRTAHMNALSALSHTHTHTHVGRWCVWIIHFHVLWWKQP